ncbi:calcium/proton exchanger [Infundibulicybe gibba]|nr:calcium/proton exchanger [Infundibulicybe gibba]
MTETAPLLPRLDTPARNSRGTQIPGPKPSWTVSLKYPFRGIFTLLLVFVPLSILSYHLAFPAILRFIFGLLAILPLTDILTTATEQLSHELGNTWAGLLNATFGNAIEIIVGIAALRQGQLRIVQTAMLGSILSNLVFGLGCSFVAAGFTYSESNFQVTAAQTSSSLMTLACISLAIPAAYHSTHPGPAISSVAGLLLISRTASILLLLVYVGYVVFQLRSHTFLFHSFGDEDSRMPGSVKMNAPAAASTLVITTILTSFCADYMVDSIEGAVNHHNISTTFIGMILIPFVSNFPIGPIVMGRKNNMGLAISMCIDSSIQVALLVIPFLVIIGWITGHELSLFFDDFETIVFFASVILVNTVIQDGKSNYMEGIMLVTLYIIIAAAFWVG